jgi:hypothetical protein
MFWKGPSIARPLICTWALPMTVTTELGVCSPCEEQKAVGAAASAGARIVAPG